MYVSMYVVIAIFFNIVAGKALFRDALLEMYVCMYYQEKSAFIALILLTDIFCYVSFSNQLLV